MMRTVVPADEILSRTHAIGQYYGFIPLSALTAKTRGSIKVKQPSAETIAKLSLDPIAQTVSSFLKQSQNITEIPSMRQPLFLWHTNIAPGRTAPKKVTIQFHALGTDRAIADAVIIRALTALARDLYHDEPTVRINSMGDKETRARYMRELGIFFKKHADDLPEDCIARSKCDTFEAAELTVAHECVDDFPTPIEHLSDASRKRFEDLLEYLERTETPYELAKNLISRGNAWNDVCFEIVVGGRRVAWGSRYNELVRHYHPGSMHAVGAVLQVMSKGAIVKKVSPARLRFSFVHIGDEAKRFSIQLAEDFRKARVPLMQYIGVESLTEQLRLAEHAKSPYLLIMGRKEALEGSAILRNRETQVETTLSIKGLIEQLRAIA